MYWEDCTSLKFAAMPRNIPVVLNIAAVEQHGAHLPVSTDALIGRHFTRRLSDDLGENVLILPQMAVCCSAHHMDFPGTLTVTHESFLAYAFDYLTSVIQHGFYNIVIFNSHGGNLAIGQVLLEKLGLSRPHVNIFMLSWWRIAAEELKPLQESRFGGVGHAGEFETSLVHYINRALIDEAAVRDNWPKTAFAWTAGDLLVGAKASVHRTMRELTNNTGVFGAPGFASEEKGKAISDVVMSVLPAMVKDIAGLEKRVPASGNNQTGALNDLC